MTEHVARSRAREWWNAELGAGENSDIKKLVPKARKALAGDPEFCSAFVEDFFDSVMYDIGQRVLAARRSALRTPAGLRKQVEEDAKRDAAKWDQWAEYFPDDHLWIPLPNMTREQVMSAANYRFTLAEKNTNEAKWLVLIANKLRPGQQVGDVLSGAELSELRRGLVSPVRKVA